MNRTFSQIRKLLLTGLFICLLFGSAFYDSPDAFADSLIPKTGQFKKIVSLEKQEAKKKADKSNIALPPGEYDHIGEAIIKTSDYGYSPYAGRTFPQQVFWGDVHLHTIYSFDAGAAGTRLTPEYAFRFARGEEVETDSGQKVRLSRPLDFLLVSDHSDGLGSLVQLINTDNATLEKGCGEDYLQVKKWRDAIIAGGEAGAQASGEIIAAFSQGNLPQCMFPSPDDFQTAWNEEIEAADEYNDPGNFTTFIGYEWTSLINGNNLHRNVIYRDGGDKVKEPLPYTSTAPGSTDPEKLWDWMEYYERTTGGNVLAIPHNGNLSNGLMFAETKINGEPLSMTYAQRRQLWEPIYEVTQIKGTGETHPLVSPDDEFADFEVAGWDTTNLDGSEPKPEDPVERKAMYEHEYARAALKNGLKFEAQLGANPFKFGLVGASDSHIAASAVEENNYFGKFVIESPSPNRATDVTSVGRVGWQYGSAGYVGVWARENTRASIFDAMERREVYATSGPRMVVRLFGGWDFTDEDLGRNPGDVGYAKGVPMGSDLSVAPDGKVPTFLVAALKDPIRANLDRIQIVKGWLDGNGETQEKVYDVAWSGSRVPDPTTGKLPPVGNTVNTETAEWTNTIGATELAKVWSDPDFDPSERAFYYARVLEIPTPRWTNYDKAFFGDEWCAKAQAEDPTACDDIPLTLQERVYTSPIWYSPA